MIMEGKDEGKGSLGEMELIMVARHLDGEMTSR